MRKMPSSLVWLRSLLLGMGMCCAACAKAPVRTVPLTIEQIRELETCVIQADDQVERQNCVERLIPVERR